MNCEQLEGSPAKLTGSPAGNCRIPAYALCETGWTALDEKALALQRRPQGRDEIAGHGCLDDKSQRARVPRGLDDFGFLPGCEEDSGGVQAARADRVQRLQPRHVRHAHVDDDGIGLQRPGGEHELCAAGDGAYHREFPVEHLEDSLEETLMIIGDQHARTILWRHLRKRSAVRAQLSTVKVCRRAYQKMTTRP